MNEHNTSSNSLTTDKDKDNKFKTQVEIVFEAFQSEPKTMLMVDALTGINRANICRYVGMWNEENKIQLVKKGLCPITKHRAGFYTTNQDFFQKTPHQATLF